MWDLKYTLDSRHIQDVIVYSLGDRHRSITENINGGFTLNQWDYHHFTYSNMLFGRYTLVSDEPMSKICWMSHADPVELAVPPFQIRGARRWSTARSVPWCRPWNFSSLLYRQNNEPKAEGEKLGATGHGQLDVGYQPMLFCGKDQEDYRQKWSLKMGGCQ